MSVTSFRVLLAAAALLLVAPRPAPAQPQAVRGEASVTTTGGYGRIVIRLASEVESRARISGNILVIEFKQPVAVAVDRLGSAATEYIGAARRDPDGRALRFALAQKLKLSSMVAGDRLFVDLLPESWQGEPPGLPREVVEELARRANEADRRARARVALEEQKKIPPVRVRVAVQPTFTRYIFELPELTGVTAERGKDKLVLAFAKPLNFDLSEAKLALPKAVGAVDATGNTETSEVRFAFTQAADVRTFREDSNYVVDVSPLDAKPVAAASKPLTVVVSPDTVPAQAEPAAPKMPAPVELPKTAETPAAAAPVEPPPVAGPAPAP
jgi:hypothetical protein